MFGFDILLINSATEDLAKSNSRNAFFCKYILCLFWLNLPVRVPDPSANFGIGFGFPRMVNVFVLAPLFVSAPVCRWDLGFFVFLHLSCAL